MKILSFNMRGAGRREKRREVRELLIKKKVHICCIQESKLEIIDNKMCKSFWGNRPYDWTFLAS
ncbi:hypothetical protein ACS0TY_014392 [Phlomoides rotata]